MGHSFLGNTDTLVDNLNQHLPIPEGTLHRDTAAIAELDGVAQQIDHHLPEPITVNLHLGQSFWNIFIYGDTLLTSWTAKTPDGVKDYVPYRQALFMYLKPARFEFRDASVLRGPLFGLLFFLLAIPGIGIIFAGFAIGGKAILVFIGLAVLYFIILGLIQSTLQAIFQAAVYLYAREGAVGAGFDENMLRGAMRTR